MKKDKYCCKKKMILNNYRSCLLRQKWNCIRSFPRRKSLFSSWYHFRHL